MQLLLTQAQYELGALDDARLSLKALRSTADSADARRLHVSLALVSGDWDSLQSFIESEWLNRAHRTATELLQAGRIAHNIGAMRGNDLIREVALNASDDPAILMNCYLFATKAGWENSQEVTQWLESAIKISDQSADGPIQTKKVDDLINARPEWEKHETDIWALIDKSEIPIFIASSYLNRSLIDLFLLPAFSNLKKNDTRRRQLVYSFSGARATNSIDPNVIALDATALLTAEFLGVLGTYMETFEKLIVPHNTLAWLFNEKADIKFHQPSLVEKAKELRRMIAVGQLEILKSEIHIQHKNVKEFGKSLAALIAVVSSTDQRDARQHLIVRYGTVYKANTFMNEEADLTEFKAYICSSIDIVEFLKKKGLLTNQEYEDSIAVVKAREKLSPAMFEINDGAYLYLDDPALSQLQSLNLLTKIYDADITIYISPSAAKEADAFINFDVQSDEIVDSVDHLRNQIRKGLNNKKVELGPASRGDDADAKMEEISAHPTVPMMKFIEFADAGVVDDRFVNQHAIISSDTATKPLLTTLDILDVFKRREAISATRYTEARTKLRRANFTFMPLNIEELRSMINSASAKDGVLIESAELRAIRESILRIKMCDVLQSPKELVWLGNIHAACLLTLKQQWEKDFSEEEAIARSDWLVQLADVKGWTHCLNEEPQHLVERYRVWLARLVSLAADQPLDVKQAYWRWLNSRFLDLVKDEEPATYNYLISHAKSEISSAVESISKEFSEGNG